MTQEGLDLVTERLEAHRTACRERYRLTQQLLREQKIELFRNNVSRTVSRDLRDSQLSLGQCLPQGVGQAGHLGGS